jgi:hypothetical protein
VDDRTAKRRVTTVAKEGFEAAYQPVTGKHISHEETSCHGERQRRKIKNLLWADKCEKKQDLCEHMTSLRGQWVSYCSFFM